MPKVAGPQSQPSHTDNQDHGLKGQITQTEQNLYPLVPPILTNAIAASGSILFLLYCLLLTLTSGSNSLHPGGYYSHPCRERLPFIATSGAYDSALQKI